MQFIVHPCYCIQLYNPCMSLLYSCTIVHTCTQYKTTKCMSLRQLLVIIFFQLRHGDIHIWTRWSNGTSGFDDDDDRVGHHHTIIWSSLSCYCFVVCPTIRKSSHTHGIVIMLLLFSTNEMFASSEQKPIFLLSHFAFRRRDLSLLKSIPFAPLYCYQCVLLLLSYCAVLKFKALILLLTHHWS